ncbi:glycosyltransferase family 2 protein [Pedobacter sp. SL55]|uniref:glycosyltransferase family 2 protein n=1 Tax=Pedobacter sp. SL55 TaxID=2995161 RepID=UPI00226EA14F|nr:glycosyltransferase family A protein [Pedobacter sp. SL55]WAC40322.1 glycosyltransferase family A protein [Pedobacter sp. SL55]
MAVYNGEKHIREAIESVLNQSFSEFELIIINDGSTDNTANILSSYNDPRFIVIQQENLGVAKSRNKAIRDVAKGKYIAILDSDDIALPTRFEVQLAFLEENQDYVMVGANAIIIDEEGNALYHSALLTDTNLIKAQLPTSNFFNSAAIFKKDAFINVGGYNETIINHIEDAILWMKFSEIGKITNLKEILIKYRLTVNSLTNKTAAAFKMQKKLLNKIAKNQAFSTKDISSLIDKNKLSKNKKESLYYSRLANIYLTKNLNRKLALTNIFRSLSINPINFSAFKQLAILTVISLKSILSKF